MGGFAAVGTGDEERSDEEKEAFQEEVRASFRTAAEGAAPPAEAAPPDEGSADAAAEGAGGELEITVSNERPGPDDDAWDRTTLGVGEGCSFWANQDGGTWTSSGGTGEPGPDGEYLWTAPDDFASVTITYTLGDATATVQIVVLAPMYINSLMIGANNDDQSPGLAGAGMDLSLTMGPTNVSFYNVEWLEDPGPVTVKDGYFDAVPDEVLYHHPNEEWLNMGDANDALTDTAAYSGAPPPFSEGSFTWLVPNRFRVAGEGGGRLFFPSIQHM
ncbi:MAG: hypothetical protein JRI25_09900, partial [Deltaproteobacteria bacterium]|nr:hypothetical protein [Deltaproteobacteria bacterium]